MSSLNVYQTVFLYLIFACFVVFLFEAPSLAPLLFDKIPVKVGDDESMEPKGLTLWPKEGHCYGLDFLIIIQIRSNDFDRRNMFRQCYGPFKKKYNFDVIFTLGQQNSTEIQDKLEEESRIHRDILQGDFMDTYRHLTHKQLMQMRYTVANCSPSIPFIMKMDDDIAVNLKHIYNMSQVVKARNNEMDTKTEGKKWKGDNIMRCVIWYKGSVIRAPYSKWYVNRSRIPENTYPPYCSGMFYIWTIETITNILEQVKTAKFLHIDDVLIGGYLAKQANVKLIDVRNSFNGGMVASWRDVKYENDGKTWWWTLPAKTEEIFKMLND